MEVRDRRIGALLDDAVDRAAVTLVCAPRGYGKTAVLARWTQGRTSVRWLRPERIDVDDVRRWAADLAPQTRPVVVVDDADGLAAAAASALLELAGGAAGGLRVVLAGYPDLPGRLLGALSGRAHTIIGDRQLALRPEERTGDAHPRSCSAWPVTAGGPAAVDALVDRLVQVLAPESARLLIAAGMLAHFDLAMLSRVVGDDAVRHLGRWIAAGAPLTATDCGDAPTFEWADGFGAAAYRRAVATDPAAAGASLRTAVDQAALHHPTAAARLAWSCGVTELAGAALVRGWPLVVFDPEPAAVLTLLDALPARQRDRPDLRALRAVITRWNTAATTTYDRGEVIVCDRIQDPDLAAFYPLAVATDVAAVATAEPKARLRVAATSPHRWVALRHLLTVIVSWWRPGRTRNMLRFEGLAQTHASDRSPALAARIDLDRATEMAFTGSFTCAMELLSTVSAPEDDGRIRAVLAMIDYWRGEFLGARRLASDVIADPRSGEFWYATARILDAYTALDAGSAPSGAFRRAVAAVPSDMLPAEVHVHRRILDAYVEIRGGRSGRALEILRPLAAGDVTPALKVVVAVACHRAGAHAEALAVFDGVLDDDLPTQVRVVGTLCRAAGRSRLGRDADARDSIGLALELAEPEGIWGPFLIGDRGVGALLRRAAHVGVAPEEPLRRVLVERAVRRSRPGLTDREREVYGHLATNRSIAEIAERIGISATTAKDHTRSLYRKLGVTDRAGAVDRME